MNAPLLRGGLSCGPPGRGPGSGRARPSADQDRAKPLLAGTASRAERNRTRAATPTRRSKPPALPGPFIPKTRVGEVAWESRVVPLFAGPLAPDESYLYHYTGSATLALILDSGELRMGPYAHTRDPRENMEWHPGYSYTGGVVARPAAFDPLAVSKAVDA